MRICATARAVLCSPWAASRALQCDSGKCPVGIATQEKSLYKGLDVSDKKVRVANFHRNTIKATIEVMEACGFTGLKDITPNKIFRRVEQGKNQSFEKIYFNQPNSNADLFKGHNLIHN